MEIKFLQKDQPNWLAYAGQIASVDWKAAAFVANKMRQRSYNDWEGVFVAVAHNQLAGFCTIVKEDIVPLQVAPLLRPCMLLPAIAAIILVSNWYLLQNGACIRSVLIRSILSLSCQVCMKNWAINKLRQPPIALGEGCVFWQK